LSDILQLLCASFNAYGYPPTLVFKLVYSLFDLTSSLSCLPPKNSNLIIGVESLNLTNVDEIIFV